MGEESSRKKALKKIRKINKRLKEIFSFPGILISIFIVRFFLSFTSWLRALLLGWGAIDGIASKALYKEEKFFPYQFLRYGRIVANVTGIINPIIPVVWNISDGLYSLYLYKKSALPVENLSRYGRIVNGALLALI